jgi:NAD(P)H dehydrogenase (quinone)
MKVSLILGHPDKGSFNQAIAQTAARRLQRSGHEVFYHDLYEEKFDPILPSDEVPKDAPLDPVIEMHCREISNADGIIIVHPNWWGQPPAILKGWIDRVLRAGVAYEFLEGDGGEGIPVGLLKARKAIIFNTSNTPEKREMEAFGDPLESLWRYCILDLCGIRDISRRTFSVVVTSTPEDRASWLREVEAMVDKCFQGEEKASLNMGDLGRSRP